MNLQTVEKALCLARVHELTTPEMRQQIDEALDEIAEITNLTKNIADIWQHEAFVIHVSDTSDLVNRNLYDMYGRMMRSNHGLVEFDTFLMCCRGGSTDNYGFEYWPTEALKTGYEIVSDLWADNESQGCNNPDGTFNKGKAAGPCGPLECEVRKHD